MKKLLSILLVVVLLITAIPLGAFEFKASAKTEGYYTYSVSNGEAKITDVDLSINGNITIPSTLGGYPVTSVGYEAFCSCECLTTITIPESIKSIYAGSFCHCDSIINIFVDVNNTNYSSLDGVLFNKNKTKLMLYPRGNEASSYTIPNTVTSIGSDAFSECGYLKSVTIPNSVISIGDNAFKYCSNINVTIPDSVTSIGDNAFEKCVRLTSITISDSVTSIGSVAFNDTGYYDDSSNWENDVLYIGNHLVSAKSTISGSYEIKPGTITIAGSVFRSCCSLKNITIPNSVISIGDNAFNCCDILTSITIPNSVTSLGRFAFKQCNNLYRVNIGDGVKLIDYDTFHGCDYLTSVTIGSSVITIGQSAFDDTSVRNVYYRGSEEDKTKISILSSNSPLSNATWHYNSCIGSAKHNYGDNGVCNVCGDKQPVIGDIDGDETVNLNDLITIAQYVAGWENLEVNTSALDVNGDGVVDLNDVTHLARYQAGWDVTLI